MYHHCNISLPSTLATPQDVHTQQLSALDGANLSKIRQGFLPVTIITSSLPPGIIASIYRSRRSSQSPADIRTIYSYLTHLAPSTFSQLSSQLTPTYPL